jgi:hypothetical protein
VVRQPEKDQMNLTARLAAVPALALAVTGLTVASAHATTDPLSVDAVNALVLASCQPDPTAPLGLDVLAPVVVGEADVAVVPGELTVHVVRADVTDSVGDVQECTFGVVHRDAQLKQVKYEGTATLAADDGLGGLAGSAVTTVDLGNMGKGRVDPRTQVGLGGFLVPAADVVQDPTYAFSIDRLALEVVPIAVGRAQKDAAGRLLTVQLKAAAQLQQRQVKAARAKHSAKAVAAAQRAYAQRVAAAQAAYDRAVAPKSVTRPVSHHFAVAGSVSLG